MLVKIYYSMKILGLFGFISAVYRRLASVKAKCFNSVKDLLVDKAGLEVGGPSNNFSDKGMLPIYSVVRSLDNCNFGNKTMWEGTLVQGQKFVFSPTQKRVTNTFVNHRISRILQMQNTIFYFHIML